MAISKVQPMRSAEVELIDVVNAHSMAIQEDSIAIDTLELSLQDEIAARTAGDAAISSAIGFPTAEVGYIGTQQIYSIITIPKAKYNINLTPAIETNPNEANTINNAALNKTNFDLICNVSNTGDFIYDGTLYGQDYVQSQHGTIMAKKPNDTDFTFFEEGTRLSSLVGLGYTEAIASWNSLISDGVVRDIDLEYQTYAEPNPRQVLAWDEDNWYIYTAYGRISAASYLCYGPTIAEIITFCQARNWPNVINLDGGGSIGIYACAPAEKLSIKLTRTWRNAHIFIGFSRKEL